MSDHLVMATPLPTTLRGLRVGLDDATHIRRMMHLAAAKIEDLQQQVTVLTAELQKASPCPDPDRRAVS